MFPRSLSPAAAALAVSVLAGAAAAQVNTLSMFGSGPEFTVTNCFGGRTSSQAGRCQLTTGTPAVNHAFQCWFWMRVGADTREYALSNQTDNISGSGWGALTYQEPANDGAIPNAVRVELQFSLVNLQPDFAKTGEAMLTINWKLHNLTNSVLPVHLFHYADLDVGGNSSGDSAIVEVNGDGRLQRVTDPGSGSQFDSRVDCIGSAWGHAGYQIAPYPTLLNSLTDSSPTTLFDVGAPFGPGDYTGAQQWDVTLGPAGALNDTFNGSVSLHVLSRCKADFNESGTLTVQDIFDFLAAWFAGCP